MGIGVSVICRRDLPGRPWEMTIDRVDEALSVTRFDTLDELTGFMKGFMDEVAKISVDILRAG